MCLAISVQRRYIYMPICCILIIACSSFHYFVGTHQVQGYAKCPSRFVNLRHLILNVHVIISAKSTSGIVRLAWLLEVAPVLEHLELHVGVLFDIYAFSAWHWLLFHAYSHQSFPLKHAILCNIYCYISCGMLPPNCCEPL